MRDSADASISPQYSDRRLRTFPTVHGTAQGDEAWAEPQRKLKAETVILRMYFDNYSGQQFLPFVDSTVRNAIVRQLLSTDGSVAFCPIHGNQRGLPSHPPISSALPSKLPTS
jgi:hypothetical protein